MIDETLDASARARQGSDLPAHLARPPEPVVPAVTQRQVFEEMCRRRRVTLPPDLRSVVYRLVGVELTIYSQVLDTPPDRVASATVYNGSLDQLLEAYSDSQDTPIVFRQAAVRNPKNPTGYLLKVLNASSRSGTHVQRAASASNQPTRLDR